MYPIIKAPAALITPPKAPIKGIAMDEAEKKAKREPTIKLILANEATFKATAPLKAPETLLTTLRTYDMALILSTLQNKHCNKSTTNT